MPALQKNTPSLRTGTNLHIWDAPVEALCQAGHDVVWITDTPGITDSEVLQRAQAEE